jgi:cytochrome c oxidase subunit 3
VTTTTFDSSRLGRQAAADDPRPLGGGARREPLLPNAIVGTLMFIATEVMFFAALISAYMVIRANNDMKWVPPESVRLPVATTAVNTGILLASGILMTLAAVRHARGKRGAATLVTYATALGSFFVALQGYEWVRLFSVGMTALSGIFAATFYLLIGMHALHAASAIAAMVWLGTKLRAGTASKPALTAMSFYWGFVVLVWPFLYAMIYF